MKGGIETLAFEEAKGLSRLAESVHVEAIGDPVTTHAAGFPNLTLNYRQLEGNAAKRLIVSLLRLVAVARSIYPHFLYTPTYRKFGLPAFVASKLLRIPFGLYLHGSEIQTESNSVIRRAILGRVLDSAAFIAVNSSFTAGMLGDNHPRICSKVKVIPPGICFEDFQGLDHVTRAATIRAEWYQALHLLNGNTHPVILLTLSRVGREKGIDLVIRAVRELRYSSRPFVYIIGGSGPSLQEFRELAERLEVSDIVHFTGKVPDADLAATYRAADIFVQPSQPYNGFIEGFGITFAEAEACGLPCVGTNWGGIPEATEPNASALLVPTGDITALSRALFELIEKPEKRRKMGVAAIAKARTMSWDKHCLHLYEEIATALRSKSHAASTSRHNRVSF